GDDSTATLNHTVTRGDFVISIVEGGTLQAVNEVVVKNAIDGDSRIIWLIPEGTYVKKDDLLVEFDTGEAEKNVEEQRVEVEARQAGLVKAENDLIITRSTADSELSEADLEVKFATMDLEKFEQLERVHKTREAELKIDTAEEALKLAQQRYEWSIKLAEKGFETKTQVDRDKLDVSLKSKEFETAKSTHQMLETFDLQKQYAEFVSKKKEAIAKLERTKKQSESKIAQDLANVNSAKITLKLKEESLAKRIEQLKATKVKAPQDGLVIYAKPRSRWGDDVQIAEGSVVRNRSNLITIPDVSSMKVSIKIHESMIGQIKKGQKSYVVLDSIPDQRFEGEVTKVAILPDSDRNWSNPDLKVYATEITIADTIEGIKPGVSAKAEIIIEELTDVLTVPIQAVTSVDGQQVCFRNNGGDLEPIPVEIGKFNTKYIEIKSGLEKGQEVMLNPPLDNRINLTGETTEE
ncbi:efflux RND transporter periplasmic adaptor subunit, partial [Akkermansiaceae bacterium]|nr:efflux RND transporter periplasmic adaptor subunit [Akkermansiaceae bacterium]